MRALPVRRIATTTLCATLLLGTAGPALASDDTAPREETRTAPRAPATPESLLIRAKELHDAGGVVTPAADLVVAVLQAKDHKLSAAQAEEHAEAVRKAAAAEPRDLPDDEATAGKAPEPPVGGLGDLQGTIDKLLTATTKGDLTGVLKEAPNLLTGLLKTVLGGTGGAAQPAAPAAGAPGTSTL
ncbi:hypothetical protein [Streptomyces flavofungini]|uniref:hypothetical protein n=1 Tax=Streptomyces flavofungini TaxID=68200 RepID=UPI0034DE778A